MENTLKKTFQNISKADYIALIAIMLIFFCMLFISYEKWGEELVDCFRNAFIADELLRGKVLYKDLFYPYGPLIVYFHSLLFKVFGAHLSVLYSCGIIISVIICLISYYLARQFFTPLSSAVLLCLFIIQMVFRPTLFQYIFPYSYESLYGSLLFFISLLLIVLYIKKDFQGQAILYTLATITSTCMFIKQDVTLSMYLAFYGLLAILFILKKKTFKELLLPALLPFIVPLALFFLIFLLSPIGNILEHFISVKRIPNVAFLRLNFLLKDFQMFFILIGGFATLVLIFYNLSKLTDKILPQINNLIKTMTICAIAILIAYNTFLNFSLSDFTTDFINNAYIWSFLFLIILIFFIIYYYIKDKNFLGKEQTILFLLAYYSTCFLIRFPLEVKLQTYCNLYLFPVLLIIAYYLTSLPLKYLQSLDKSHYSTASQLTCIIFTLIILVNYSTYYSYKHILVETPKGRIYSSAFKANQINQTLAFIMNNSDKNATLLSPPDDLIYNFLADRTSPIYFPQLLPGTVYDEDQKEIIKQLENNKPDIITTSTNDVVNLYGKKQWGIDYNTKINRWVQNNYQLAAFTNEKTITTNQLLPYQVFIFTQKPQ